MRKSLVFNTPENLKFFFTPTANKKGEIRKANIKNLNLPVLQLWFNGSESEPLKCLITNKPAFSNFPDIVTGRKKQRFDCDFNHIRQFQDGRCHSGISLDKGSVGPSDIIRTYDLSLDKNKDYLVEIMTTMTISSEFHSYFSQDSAKGHITLTNLKKKWWPWGLKNEKNFNFFCKKFNLNLDYNSFISRLSDITWPDIVESYSLGTLSKI